MKIAGYIADLLYEYECVVIPGLGGFLTRDHAAYIHPMKHYFKPPHREVVFNPMLRTNDGLLLSHIARYEQLSYQEAKYRLDRFVLKCLSVMDEGKKIHFRHIGSIAYDKEKKIVFEPDASQNYLASSFGLAGFVSPPVKREDFQRRVERVFSSPPPQPETETPVPVAEPKKPVRQERMLASRRPNRLKKQLVIVGAAASLLLAAWGTMNYQTVHHYYEQYKGQASMLPVFYASPNEYVISHFEKFPVESMVPDQNLIQLPKGIFKARAGINDLVPAKPYQAEVDDEPVVVPSENADADMLSAGETSQPKTSDMDTVQGMSLFPEMTIGTNREAEQPVEEVKAQPEKVDLPATTLPQPVEAAAGRYHIIAGAFREKANAEKLIATLKSKNFEATYAGQTSTGLWRVSYGAIVSKEQALQQLQTIKQTENQHAWLFEI